MPVITIELNDQALFRQKSVNAKLTTDDVLWLVNYADRIEDGITDLFYSCSMATLLCCIHFNQHSAAIGVSISTIERAIQYIRLVFTRRRPSELVPAYLAIISVFVSALPNNLMVKAAKVSIDSLYSVFRKIEGFTAVFACNIPAGLAVRFWRSARASNRTEPLLWAKVIGGFLATIITNDGPNFIAKFAFHITNYTTNTATVKPIALTRYVFGGTMIHPFPAFLTARHDRLRRLYSDRQPLPGHARPMTFQELTKLMRCVTMEVTNEA